MAHDFFEKELELHRLGTGFTESVQTVAILQDDCYGHRYSRPRTSRANLNTIVERPERIHAIILGLATAYVRLGGRHAEGAAAPVPESNHDTLPPGSFRIQKTARRLNLKSPAATFIHGTQWMGDLIDMCDAAESKLALSGKELVRPNVSAQPGTYTDEGKLHEGDLYLCSKSLAALEGALGGVCEGVDAVFKEHGPKRAFVGIRPPGHHCSAKMPSGFCWLNNVHVGIGHAVLTHGLTHAAIIDFDLHHGDGSQSITWAHNARVASMPKNTSLSKRTAIGYFSLHDINSYPCEMGEDDKVRNASLCIENAHGQNIWNVHLQPWKTEAEFWQLYHDKYSVILTKARNFLQLHSEKLRHVSTHPKPRAAIFLSAGFDASEWESPGMQRHQVNVPTSFYARLTRDVVMMAEEEGLGVDGRVISVLEGGYSDRALMSGTLSHLSGLTTTLASKDQAQRVNGVGSHVEHRLEKLDLYGDLNNPGMGRAQGPPEAFDTEWWSLQQIEELEKLTNPQNSAVTVPKKQRSETRPTYTSATQSYTAKIVTPPKSRRSSHIGNNLYQSANTRASSPPPPVDWAMAAYELSKLLVPSDRETKSCKPEDLNAEASRARRDRFSTVGLPASTEMLSNGSDLKRMQLRDRRGKTPQNVSGDEEVQPKSRGDRRKTIADVSLLVDDSKEPAHRPGVTEPGMFSGRTRRRSSIASNASSINAEKGSDFGLESVTNAQTKRQPLIIKKSRATSNPRAEAAKAKTNKKQPPVPRFPADTSNSSVATNPEYHAPTPSTQAGANESVIVHNESHNKDLDQLSSGMRTMSIKLNVPSKEEYDARHSKPKAASKGRVPKSVVGKSASPAKPKVKAVKDPSLPKSSPAHLLPDQQLPSAVPSGGHDPATTVAMPSPPPAPKLLLEPVAQEKPLATDTPASDFSEPSAHSNDMSADVRELQGASDSHNGKPAVASEAASQSSPAFQQQSPKKMQPIEPFIVKRYKEDLPVFTSTSPISFGKPDVLHGSLGQTLEQDVRGPSSVGHNGLHQVPQQPPGYVPSADKSIGGPSAVDDHIKQTDPAPASSIWDVPDTPRPPKP